MVFISRFRRHFFRGDSPMQHLNYRLQKGFWAWGVVLLIFFASTAYGGKEPTERIAEGRRLYLGYRFSDAITILVPLVKGLKPETQGDLYLEAVMVIGLSYQALGHLSDALSWYETAKPVAQKSKNMEKQALFFSQMGVLCTALNRLDKAYQYLEVSMADAGMIQNPKTIASIYNNIGKAFALTSDDSSAAALFEESLSHLKELKKQDALMSAPLSVKILLNLAQAYNASGEYQKMEANLNDAVILIRQMPVSANRVFDSITASLLYFDWIEHFPASQKEVTPVIYDLLTSARAGAVSMGNTALLASAIGYLGKLYETEGRFEEAVTLSREAIFHAETGNYPEILYLFLWQQGRIYALLGKIDQAVSAYEEAIATLSPVRDELFETYAYQKDAFNRKIRRVYLGLARLYLIQAEGIEEKERQQAKIRQAQDVMEILKTAELDNFFKDKCVTAQARNRKHLDRAPAGTAIIYPIVLPDSLKLLVTLSDGIQQFTVSVDQTVMTNTVTGYRKKLQTRTNNRFLNDSKMLYDWLIRPMEKALAARNIHTLIIAPDSVLRLIPFSTLYDGDTFLIQKYALVTIPAITLSDPGGPPPEKMEILIGGISEARDGFPALPQVANELKDIQKIMHAEAVLKNREFTLSNIEKKFSEKSYDVIHIATHGVFGGSPDDTFLLAYDGRMTMNELEAMITKSRFRERPVQLLTLSACQTAFGNERAAMGLAGAAVKAGVRAVIATLWYVDDEATSLVIREFYRQLNQPNMTKAQALQKAQIALLSQDRYWHPIFWAPFLIIGNWM